MVYNLFTVFYFLAKLSKKMKNSNQNVYKDALRGIVRKQIYLSAPYHQETCFIFSLSHSVILESKMEAI